jgi:hypothetical protein
MKIPERVPATKKMASPSVLAAKLRFAAAETVEVIFFCAPFGDFHC